MQNRNYNTKAIVEAGLITSLVVILMLMSVYIPIFSLIGIFILPIPITVLFIRQNYKVTIVSVVISAIIIGMVFNPISAVSSSILFGLTGITLGYLIKNDKSISTIILFLAAAFAAAMIVDFGIYISLIDKRGLVGFVNDIAAQFKDSMNMVKQMYSKMGVSSEQLASLDQVSSMFNTKYIMSIIPALIVMISVTFSYLNYTITKKILKKLRYNVKSIAPFSELYVSAKTGSLIGIVLVIGLFLKRNNIALGDSIAISSQYILQLVLLLDGFALAAYYLKNKFKMSKTFTFIIILLTGFSQIAVVYMLAGLSDIFFDFRKINLHKREEKR
ncbi:YybS family protein [Clostridium sp. JN-1]|uniref:YybS family protein n=1 Tax=Clostridium sp. JN-1 TaxID=2483110 RepID=UPI000F0BA100|nr:YybS family protein [Clostridium sp. JN-1]